MPRLRRLILMRVAFAAALVAVIATAWSIRLPVSGRLLTAALGAAGYDAALRVTALDGGRIAFADLRLGDPDAPDVAARAAQVRFRLSEILSGRIRALELEDAAIRARLDGEGLSVAGLALGWRDRAARLVLSDVRVRLDTPYGPLEAQVDAGGDREQGWRAHVVARTPNDLDTPARLLIETAVFDAVLTPEAATASLSVALADLSAPSWRLGRTTLEGQFEGLLEDPADWRSLAGEGGLALATEGGGLEADAAARVAAALTPTPQGPVAAALAPHFTEARFALESALRAFAITGDFGFRLKGPRLEGRLNAPLRLSGASGARLDLRMSSRASLHVDVAAGEATLRRFRARLRGDGLPRLTSRIDLMAIKPRARREPWLLVDADLSADPWDVADISAGMELDLLRVALERRAWRVSAAGRAAVDGARDGVMIRGLGLAADVEILGQGGVVAVTPRDGAVARATVQDIVTARGALRDVSLQVRPAPAGRPLLSVDRNGLGLAATLRDVDLLAARPDIGARVRALAVEVLHDAKNDGARSWRLRVQGPRVDGRLADGDRVRMDARVIDGGWDTPASAPPAAAADAAPADEVGEATTDAAGAEARLTFETLSLSAEKGLAALTDAAGELALTVRPDAPVTGAATIARALVRDRAPLARFAPVRVSLTADVEGAAVEGVLRAALAESGEEVMQADVVYDAAARAGEARYATPLVTVGRGRLGLADVSPLLAAAVREAAGAFQAQGVAAFRLQPDPRTPVSLDAMSLRLSLADIDLATPLGRLEGVGAELDFIDVVRPHTRGPQAVAAAAYRPGVALTDIEGALALADGVVAGDPVRGSLAGGELALEPIEVDIARRTATGVLAVRNLDLARLAVAAKRPDLALTGQVSGGGYIRAEPLSVRLENVRLAALGPGVAPLRGPPPAATGSPEGGSPGGDAGAGRSADNADAEAAAGAATLQPFAYERLELALDGDLRAVTLVLEAWPTDGGAPRRETVLLDLAEILRAARDDPA